MKKEPTPRQRQALEMRAKIQSAALTLFNREGFENVSVEEIAQKAGCSVGNIYHYFKSKDELAIQVTSHVDAAYLTLEAEYLADSTRTSREKLLDFVGQSLRISSSDPVLYKAFIHAMKYPEQGALQRNEHRIYFRVLSELVELCRAKNVGFIAMKGLSGGLITNSAAAYAFEAQYDNVLPIWGVQHESELDEFLQCIRDGIELTDARKARIERDRKELCGNFCRSCGYCLPCPAGIDIPQAARMSRLLRRSPYKPYMSDEWHKKMHMIDDCRGCGACASRCPYGLNTPKLLKEMLADYDEFYAEHKN